ncbi:Zn(II)2Cys6 transcription factor [Penicillium lividum]|nr:Zn(II)2Cys6 transcription factor [Penicillium lividum]
MVEAAIRDSQGVEKRLRQTSLEVSPTGRLSTGNHARPSFGEDSLPSPSTITLYSPAPTKRDYTTYQEENTDGLATVTAFSDTPDDGEGPYYGPSSNIRLMKQICSALLHSRALYAWHQLPPSSDRRPRDKFDASEDSGPSQSLGGLQNQAINPYDLPPLNEAHAYINHFFTEVSLFLCCIHQISFLEKFRSYVADLQQRRQSGISRVWLGTLNLVFAISRTTMEGHTPDANKLAACEVFYQRAMKLGWERALRGRSVEAVQFLYLKSAFLQGTEQPLEVWTAHSFAVNAAYSIGLHTTRPNSALTPLEKEVRMRTWYCLFRDDQVLSIAWGRPALTAGVLPSLVTPVKGDGGFYPASTPKRVTDMISSYLASTVSLGLIGQKTINDLYGHNCDSDTKVDIFETISRTMKICWNINTWKESLPAALQPPTEGEILKWGSDADLHITRLRQMLSLHYHYQLVTAYRAVLTRFLDDSPTSVNSNETHTSVRRTGVVLLQDCASKEQINLNGAWWQCSYFVFNASLVLCGILIAIPKRADQSWVTPESFFEDTSEAFRRGVKVIKDLDRGSAMISRCYHVLNRFAELLLDLPHMKQQQNVVAVDGDCSLLSTQNSSVNNMPQWFSVRDMTNSNGNDVDGSHQTTAEGLFGAIQGTGTDAYNFGLAGVEHLFDSLDSNSFAAGFL